MNDPQECNNHNSNVFPKKKYNFFRIIKFVFHPFFVGLIGCYVFTPIQVCVLAAMIVSREIYNEFKKGER